jgi:hypothetical protein
MSHLSHGPLFSAYNICGSVEIISSASGCTDAAAHVFVYMQTLR